MDEKTLTNYGYKFRPDLLSGKVAFVTGGGSGICFTIAEVLMRHKCKVAIASRNFEKLKIAAEKLVAATGGECLPIQMDVRKPQDVLRGVDECLSHYNRIDYLINGAAGNFLCPAVSLSFNAFKTVMEIDTMGTFNVSKTVYEKYLRDHGGVIINITATLQLNGMALQAHAGAAKAAIDALTRHLAVEWGPNQVRVVGLAPGPIKGTVGFDKLGGNQMKDHERIIPIGRCGEKVEIADSVLFLVSDAASLITGETIIADGGSWLSAPNSMALMMDRLGGGRNSLKKSKL
ncbi:peroxisomal 2,4-dienoyl-CoA reductase [(3E)-enoyl-CoA-producing]-like [Lineus longissimus]|uniref:peroxisomal 2,4-dienoyl-CoA reductase [(3E)-enoyl-CoA-producing]-like n=1 Tax=Lineus longissimus TaxID=88925 RepID=UPI002B4F56FB